MEFNLTGIDERLLGAERPFERMLVLYIQMYERMVPSFSQNLKLEDWDSILTSLDLMVKYLSEIENYNLTAEFIEMRNLYVSMIEESIIEIEEAIKDD